MGSRFMAAMRSQHWYQLVKAELDLHGITDFDLVPPTGKGHPKLIVRMNGKTMKTPVPSTERGGGDHKYLVARIRKFACNA